MWGIYSFKVPIKHLFDVPKSVNPNVCSLVLYLPTTLKKILKRTGSINQSIMGAETFVEIILAIILPPIGVFLRYGCGIEFWICLLLTFLGYVPGIIYAIYVLVV
ncbi:putative proteolipid membrane potential modulator [Helianthus debilis subsp. tardiflorus]